MDLSFYSYILLNKMDLFQNSSVARSPKSLIWRGKTALLWAQEAKGMSSASAASPPHFFFSVPVPHALRAQLALCSPLILHWTVRMDFAVLSQLK